jgi:hypothetical protein
MAHTVNFTAGDSCLRHHCQVSYPPDCIGSCRENFLLRTQPNKTKMDCSVLTLFALPTEILLLTLIEVPNEDIINFRLTCKAARDIVDSQRQPLKSSETNLWRSWLN